MKKLNLAYLSDIHIGHRRNSASEIITNLRSAIPDNAETSKLDIIFLAGDVFDDLLSLNNADILTIDAWIAYLLRICAKHNIMLRVLEGTPSHDWKQSARFVSINEIALIKADLKYVTDLSIEYIEKHDIHVLYVPDEWMHSTEKTLEQAKELLKAKGLDQVDYAAMHGQFEYQLPAHVKAQKHSSVEYLKLVKYLIVIGHIHLHSQFERIIAPGSFDRLAHGEEEPKGHLRISRYGEDHEIVFVENKNAKQFITIDCRNLSLDDTMAKAEECAKNLPSDSYVRIEANHDNPIFTNMEPLIRNYIGINWSKLPREDKVNNKNEEIETDDVYVPVALTRDNLSAMVIERMINNGISNTVIEAAQQTILELF